MIKVSSRAPTRIDLAGGTIDLWPIHQLLDQKATVNVGVTLDAQVEITESADSDFHVESQDLGISAHGDFFSITQNLKLPLIGLMIKAIWRQDLPNLTIITAARSPAGAGLGGSSCLAIALAAALFKARDQAGYQPSTGETSTPDERGLVALASDIEAKLIHAPTGIQDYWGAVRGAVNVIRFPAGRIDVTTKSPASVRGLEEQLLLCYSGKSRASAINNWEIFKRVFDGDETLLATLNEIGAASERCADAIADGNLSRAILVSSLEWQLRCKLWPNIESAETKRLDIAAKKSGALFTRVCGAGGGGVMSVFVEPDSRERVKAALVENGGIVLNAKVADRGVTVT